MITAVLILSVALFIVVFVPKKRPATAPVEEAPAAPKEEVIEDATKIEWYVSGDRYTRTIIFGCIQAQVRAEMVDPNQRPGEPTGVIEWEVGVILPTAILGLRERQGYLCVLTGRVDEENEIPKSNYAEMSDAEKTATIQRRLDFAQEEARAFCPKVAALLRRGAAPWLVGAP